MSDKEYNLTGAGAFTEDDLLDFWQSELEKGNHITKIWVTNQQANYLANSLGTVKAELTGKKLVDFWGMTRGEVTLKSIHGIEVGVDE